MASHIDPRVPPELVHLIFRDADNPSLFACSLACRAWFQLARPYLFKKVAWRFRPKHFQKVREGDTETGEHLVALEHLLRFLENNPDVGPHIRDLTIGLKKLWRPHTIMYSDDIWESILEDSRVDFCRLETLANVLHRIPSLQSLRIDDVPFHQPGPAFALTLVSRPLVSRAWRSNRGVRVLELTRSTRPSWSSLPYSARLRRLILAKFTPQSRPLMLSSTSPSKSTHSSWRNMNPSGASLHFQRFICCKG